MNLMKKTIPFTGRWRIVSLEAFYQDYIDEEEEVFLRSPPVAGASFILATSKAKWIAF